MNRKVKFEGGNVLGYITKVKEDSFIWEPMPPIAPTTEFKFNEIRGLYYWDENAGEWIKLNVND